ncbi:MAG: helix-turn-helix domain-containing protein [Clostridia bacterium]|nr:helix-turn-helix domain-containing protein [Clostridia bacterium]
MNTERLNPVIRSAALYECINRADECVAYDSRVIYIITGDIMATVGGERVGHLTPGTLLYIPAGVAYKLKSKYFKAAVITFDFTDVNPLPEERMSPVPMADFDASLCHNTDIEPPFDKYFKIDDIEGDRELFERMCNIFTSAEGCYRARVSAMFKLEILKLLETVDDGALPARMVEELDAYIRENSGDEISNTEIGAIFGYHPFYVSRILKERKGMTLRQYIIAYRIKAAKKLLEVSGKTVNEIAEELGFTDASYFTKVFKSEVGETPKEYRNRFKEDFI